jgi:hypothetical protein
MPDSDQSLERLAELIWRTVKLRVALLVAGAVLLLITWSGLSNGNADANKLDIEYCTHVEQETSDALEKLAPSWKDRSSFYCSPANARLTIESGRAFSTILPLEGEPFERQKSELADYDRKRRAAYKLEIGLSSQGAESKNGHAQYPLDPSLFVEVRVQLFIVAMFLVAVLLVPAFRKAGKGVRTAFSRAHQLLAFLTLFLILNYLLYMGSLEYLSMSDADFSAAWLMGVMNRDAGYTLSSYDPAYGFVIFVCCCLALCCFSLLAVESAGDND